MQEGDFIDQRFRIEKKLGQGGMGEVFRGTDEKLKKTVAIKVLFPNTPDLVIKRFHTEAKALAALNHPNVMKVLDFGQALDGQLYLVMDYVKGESLSTMIEKRGVQTFFDVLPIFEKICRGLRFAHMNNVLHRDIKPSNVMMENDRSKEDSVKLVDFGLAKLVKQDHELTTAGSAMGSPPYMSPEAVHGKESDERSDIYSLGCTFFEMMAGRPPFMGDTPFHTMMAHLNRLAPTLSEITEKEYDEEVEEFIKKCIKKNPDDRFQNMDELIAELERVKNKLIDKRQSAMGALASGVYSSGSFLLGQARKIAIFKKLSVPIIAVVCGVVVVIAVAVVLPLAHHEKSEEIQSGSLSEITQAAEQTIDSKEKLEDIVNHRARFKRGLTMIKDPGSPFQMCVLSGKLSREELKTLVKPHKQNEVFEFIDLEVDDESLRYLSMLPIQKLLIQHTPMSDALVTAVGNMSNLIHIVFRDCGDMPDDALDRFKYLKLQTADFRLGKKYKNFGAQLAKIRTLNSIILEEASVTREDIKQIATLPALGMLNFQSCDLANDALADLKNSKTLMFFTNVKGPLTEQQAEHISELPNLASINFHRTDMTDDWLKKFYKCKNLQQASFTYTSVTDEGAEALQKQVPTLREVHVGSDAPEEHLINDYSKIE